MFDVSLESSFFQAIADNNKATVYQMLQENPALANTSSVSSSVPLVFFLREDNCISPLLFAASKGLNDIIDLLVQANANLHFQDNEGQSVLHAAIRFGHVKTVDHLTRYYGLSLHQKNIHGFSPLMVALWAMQSEMALFLMQYYINEISVGERSNNAFANTISKLYQLTPFSESEILDDYNTVRFHDDKGFDALSLTQERWRQERANFKQKLMKMLDNQEEERTSAALVADMQRLKKALNNAGDAKSIELVLNEVLRSVYFATSSKAMLANEFNKIKKYEETKELFLLKQSLNTLLNEGDIFQLAEKLASLSTETLAKIIYWPDVIQILSQVDHSIVLNLAQHALENYSVDLLTKLLLEKLMTEQELMDLLEREPMEIHVNEDGYEEENESESEINQKLCAYLASALAQNSDATLTVDGNFAEFLPLIEKSRSGIHADLAQWLVIHHEMTLGSENPDQSHAALIFQQLLKLSDRDQSKMMMLRRFAEVVSQQGNGMRGQFEFAPTPFMLLLQLYGPKEMLAQEVPASDKRKEAFFPSLQAHKQESILQPSENGPTKGKNKPPF